MQSDPAHLAALIILAVWPNCEKWLYSDEPSVSLFFSFTTLQVQWNKNTDVSATNTYKTVIHLLLGIQIFHGPTNYS